MSSYYKSSESEDFDEAQVERFYMGDDSKHNEAKTNRFAVLGLVFTLLVTMSLGAIGKNVFSLIAALFPMNSTT
jgi:hypothetical protein